MRDALKQANDLDKRWPVNDLLDTLDLITMTRMRLDVHFAKEGIQELSLRDLMNLAYSEIVADGKVTLDYPLLRIRGVGKKGFWSVANQLTRLDLGGQCNLEWNFRLARIKGIWRIQGPTPYWKG